MRTPHIRRNPSRKLDAILARLEQRACLPETFAPDFLHGNFTLSQGYDALSPHIESMGFVVMGDETVSVGIFQDHFLTIYTHERDGGEVNWMQRLGESLSSWLVFNQGECLAGEELPLNAPISTVQVSNQEFLAAEHALLAVAREEDVLTPQTSVLSLIGLYVRGMRKNLSGYIKRAA